MKAAPMRRRTTTIMALAALCLGVAYYLSDRNGPEPPTGAGIPVWSVDPDDLMKLAIFLPAEDKRGAWAKHDDEYWYFDEPEGRKVDMSRWGGGIPLLLSGPRANRRVSQDASDEQLRSFGLDTPGMKLRITLRNGEEFEIDVGDRTPDRQSHYIRPAGRRSVFTVDRTWYAVIERLVLDPPYPPG